MGNKLA